MTLRFCGKAFGFFLPSKLPPPFSFFPAYKSLRKYLVSVWLLQVYYHWSRHPLPRNLDDNTSQAATNIYNLEVVFDPKSAFNYHVRYTGKKYYHFQNKANSGGCSYFKASITNYS